MMSHTAQCPFCGGPCSDDVARQTACLTGTKTCLECGHLGFRQAEPDYSEVTPGCSVEMYCMKSVWQYDAYNDSLTRLRNKLYTARTCDLFSRSKE